MVTKVDRYVNIVLTEGGADAFAQTSIATGIIPDDGEAWQITLIECQFAASQLQALSADHNIVIAVARDSKTTIPALSDPDVVTMFGFAGALTTSGTYRNDVIQKFVPPEGTIFVEPTIYFQIDSDGTGQAMETNIRLHYELVKVSEIDILRLLQNS